jgi:hypothetical protein
MGIASNTFARTFGNLGNPSNAQRTYDRPKAELWMNIGYSTEIENAETGKVEHRFVSLPRGIPLDTMEKVPTDSRNQLVAAFQGARNDLLEQIMDAAKHLEPGEEKIIGEAGGLQLQIRRVTGKARAVRPSGNPFRRPVMPVE